jgi:hypothetical protein
MNNSILKDLTSPPKEGRNKLYRWCDYVELRCLAHRDKRFSRDSLAEAIEENRDSDADDTPENIGESDLDDGLLLGNDNIGIEIDLDTYGEIAAEKDKYEEHAAFCFKHFRWREIAFGEQWPFVIDTYAQEISLKEDLTDQQKLYISLLLSSSLKYIPKKRWRGITGIFEKASIEIMKHLMPTGSEVHAFGAADSSRYTGHLHDRLCTLAADINAHLLTKKSHFDPRDTGDCGLDIVAWHTLGDGRKGMPLAFAQCGCTADGWPDKMLQASPARISIHLAVSHFWATYYFMPLDLSTTDDDKIDWQYYSNFSQAIVIDRLRFLNLSNAYNIVPASMTAEEYVLDALATNET